MNASTNAVYITKSNINPSEVIIMSVVMIVGMILICLYIDLYCAYRY